MAFELIKFNDHITFDVYDLLEIEDIAKIAMYCYLTGRTITFDDKIYDCINIRERRDSYEIEEITIFLKSYRDEFLFLFIMLNTNNLSKTIFINGYHSVFCFEPLFIENLNRVYRDYKLLPTMLRRNIQIVFNQTKEIHYEPDEDTLELWENTCMSRQVKSAKK